MLGAPVRKARQSAFTAETGGADQGGYKGGERELRMILGCFDFGETLLQIKAKIRKK